MSATYSFERDLDELERMTEGLQAYLLSDALYLPIGGGSYRGGSTAQLTAGSLLLRRRRLLQLRSGLNPAQQARLTTALKWHDDIQSEWTLHYEQKLKQEVPARLKMMTSFFRDCRESPRDCAAAYPIEALRRTIVEEILLAMEEFAYDQRGLMGDLQRTDLALRAYVNAGAFIWATVLQPVYPPDTFWWLHGKPDAG